MCATATLLLDARARAPSARADGVRATHGPLWASYPTMHAAVRGHRAGTPRSTCCRTRAIAQRFTYPGNIAACSLKVSPSYTFGRLISCSGTTRRCSRPRPSRCAGVSLNSSNMAWNWLHVAEPAASSRARSGTSPIRRRPPARWCTGYRTRTTRRISATSATARRRCRSGCGAPGVRRGRRCRPARRARASLGGDATLQDLRVVQGVMKTDGMPPRVSYEALQRFRVPRMVRVGRGRARQRDGGLLPDRPGLRAARRHRRDAACRDAATARRRVALAAGTAARVGEPLRLRQFALVPLPAWTAASRHDRHYRAAHAHAHGKQARTSRAGSARCGCATSGYNWAAGRRARTVVPRDRRHRREPRRRRAGARRSPLELRATPNPRAARARSRGAAPWGA